MKTSCPNRHRPDAGCNAQAVQTCHKCGTVAPTMLLELSSGLIGRVCPACRTCRRPRPYATKREFMNSNRNTANAVEVEDHADTRKR